MGLTMRRHVELIKLRAAGDLGCAVYFLRPLLFPHPGIGLAGRACGDRWARLVRPNGKLRVAQAAGNPHVAAQRSGFGDLATLLAQFSHLREFPQIMPLWVFRLFDQAAVIRIEAEFGGHSFDFTCVNRVFIRSHRQSEALYTCRRRFTVTRQMPHCIAFLVVCHMT